MLTAIISSVATSVGPENRIARGPFFDCCPFLFLAPASSQVMGMRKLQLQQRSARALVRPSLLLVSRTHLVLAIVSAVIVAINLTRESVSGGSATPEIYTYPSLSVLIPGPFNIWCSIVTAFFGFIGVIGVSKSWRAFTCTYFLFCLVTMMLFLWYGGRILYDKQDNLGVHARCNNNVCYLNENDDDIEPYCLPRGGWLGSIYLIQGLLSLSASLIFVCSDFLNGNLSPSTSHGFGKTAPVEE